MPRLYSLSRFRPTLLSGSLSKSNTTPDPTVGAKLGFNRGPNEFVELPIGDNTNVDEIIAGVFACKKNPASHREHMSAITPALALALAQPPTPPNNLNSNNSILEFISYLFDSILNDEEDALRSYFFSIFIQLEDDIKKKSYASTNTTLTLDQKKELSETLKKCANAYNSGDTNPTHSDSSDTQSSPTKTNSASSLTSKEKAQPPVYFGVGIKTELNENGNEKFLKITEIFINSNLHKKKQNNADYTNQFITHLNCKLGDDTVASEYSITDIFNKFKGDPNQKEKFDEKIDQIFRDITQTSIKFKISPGESKSASSEFNINKIIFEKTPDGAYKQKTTTPSSTTSTRFATGAGLVGPDGGVEDGVAV